MNKILDIVIEENATFSRLLTLTTSSAVKIGTNPISKEDVFEEQQNPMDLTGFTFEATIKKSFESPKPTESFDIQILDAVGGTMYLSMSKDKTALLDTGITWGTNSSYGTPSERVGLLGYYDVIATKDGKTTRLFQGRVYISRGTSGDTSNIETDITTVTRSSITAIGTDIDLPVSNKFSNTKASIEYFNGSVPATPSAGTTSVYVSASAQGTYTDPIGTISAKVPDSEIGWHTTSEKVKVTTTGIVGADSYRLTVVSNKYRG